MTAGLCGKRPEYEETFGSPIAKRSRCSSYGPPVRIAGIGIAEEDNISILIRMYPSMDRKVLETILTSSDNNIDQAIKNLDALYIGEMSMKIEADDASSEFHSNGNGGVEAAIYPNVEPNLESKEIRGTSLVDIFVQEMMNASDWNDVRNRSVKILESFKEMVVAHSTSSKEQEIASLKEQLQCLMRDNQILKRAVAIQHEHSSQFEDKLKEVQHLKSIISQYQEQVRILELTNYSLKIHLQRAQEATSIPSRFHPDIF